MSEDEFEITAPVEETAFDNTYIGRLFDDDDE
jgi:hypothetical protein